MQIALLVVGALMILGSAEAGREMLPPTPPSKSSPEESSSPPGNGVVLVPIVCIPVAIACFVIAFTVY